MSSWSDVKEIVRDFQQIGTILWEDMTWFGHCTIFLPIAIVVYVGTFLLIMMISVWCLLDLVIERWPFLNTDVWKGDLFFKD